MTDLVPIPGAFTPSRELTPNTITIIMTLAPTIHASRMFQGIASPEQAAVVMLKGHELGFTFTAAFEYIEMIQGKATLKPQGALALIHRSGNFDITITDETDGCVVTMKRRDTGFAYTAHFGLADAQAAGLVKDGSGYSKYPADMFRARAVARCARVVAPDVLAGLYLTPELQTIDSSEADDER